MRLRHAESLDEHREGHGPAQHRNCHPVAELCSDTRADAIPDIRADTCADGIAEDGRADIHADIGPDGSTEHGPFPWYDGTIDGTDTAADTDTDHDTNTQTVCRHDQQGHCQQDCVR